ncbi:hypothetical protein MRB53_039156 [Persea americana]|nr:hypothetical protein MRB53_039156 [Persea americana]
MFLFSDCLIYATPTVSGNVLDGFLEYYIFNRRIPLDDLVVEKDKQKTSVGVRYCLRFLSSTKSFLAYCSSEQSQIEWFDAIERTKLENMKAKCSFRVVPQLTASPTAKVMSFSLPILSTIAWGLGWNTEKEYPVL